MSILTNCYINEKTTVLTELIKSGARCDHSVFLRLNYSNFGEQFSRRENLEIAGVAELVDASDSKSDSRK